MGAGSGSGASAGEGARTGRRRAGPGSWALVALVLVGLALLVGWPLREAREQRASFPRTQGRLEVAGLDAALDVLRDSRGVPHVFAATASDAWTGLGFVHAQDRLGQMERLRRSARGELAALEGPRALPGDRLARTLGLSQRADTDWQRLPRRSRRVLEAYARGVNAHLGALRSGQSAPPLGLAAVPEDWAPVDSLAVWKQHAWALSATHEEALVLGELLRRFGGLDAGLFFPRSVGLSALPPRPDTVTRARGAMPPGTTAPLRHRLGLAGASIGSTAFVISARLGRAGALLAADTHLSPTAPAGLHQAHVQGGDLDVAGAAVPGVPAFWSGFNGSLAWASTLLPVLATDLLDESLGGDRPGARVEEREETLEVLGAPPETLVVRETRRGPILGAAIAGGSDLVVRWPGLGVDPGPTGLIDLTRAAGLEDAQAALARHHVPILEVVLLDADGEGVRQVAGFVPDRRLPTGGVPVPARDRAYRWNDRIAPELLPTRRLGDPDRVLVAADALPEGWRRARMELSWRPGSRAAQVRSLVEVAGREGGLDYRDLAVIQTDVWSPDARALVAESLDLIGPDPSLPHESREAVRLLLAWDGRSSATSAGAAAYQLFLDELVRRLFEPRLGQALLDRYLGLRGVSAAQLALRVVRDAADGGEMPGGWADRDAVQAAIRASLRDVWIRGGVLLGANRDKWSWGTLHTLTFAPSPLAAWGRAGAALGPFPYGGDGGSVQMAERTRSSFESRVVASFRMTLAARNLDQALTSLAPGQSEHPGHPHAADGLAGWREGRPRLLSRSRAVVEDGPVARLRLEPAP